jgi:phosphatidylserine/phosphatidylglycerophosphate/cardiolipin synthase-like enzyme
MRAQEFVARQEGFNSMSANEPQLLVTGRHFTGRGLRAIGPVIEQMLLSAKDEIQIIAYVFTNSAAPVIDQLQRALEKGIRVTVVINNLEAHPPLISEKLHSLRDRFPHATVKSFQSEDGSQLHAKAIVVDHRQALIGSANFTWGGMVGNHELAVLLHGQSAWTLAEFISRLAQSL